MKNFFTIILIAGLLTYGSSASSSTKKIRSKTVSSRVLQIKYPKIKIPKDNFSYQFELHRPAYQYYIASRFFSGDLDIKGWKEENENPGLYIDLYMGELSYSECCVQIEYETKCVTAIHPVDSHRYTRTDTVRIVYTKDINISGRSRLKIWNSDKEQLYSTYLRGFDKVVETPEFESECDLNRWITCNINSILEDCSQEYYRDQRRKCISVVDDQIGLYEYRKRISLLQIASKRDPLYEEFNAQVQGLENLLLKYRPFENGEEIRSEIVEYQNYFEGILKEEGQSNRDISLRYIVARNLAVMHSVVENYDDALDYAEVWLSTDKSKFLAKLLQECIYRQKELIALNDWNF